ncbi:MAG: hypothetical protein ABW169_09490 [Sphingobium sp.]
MIPIDFPASALLTTRQHVAAAALILATIIVPVALLCAVVG